MIILVYGDDTYRVLEKSGGMISSFKTKFDASGMNVAEFTFDGNDGDIMSAVCAPPFLADRRMIVVKGLAEATTRKVDAELWAKRLAGRGDETIIVLVDDLSLDRAKKNKLYVAIEAVEAPHTYTFGLMTERELSEWVERRVSLSGSEWDRAAVGALVERTGADTWRLVQEIKKVSAAADKINSKLVEELVAPAFQDTLFAFLDAVRSDNAKRAVQLLQNELIRGTAPAQLITMLLREAKLLMELRAFGALYGPQAIKEAARELSIHPFVAKKSMPRALSIKSDALRYMIERTLEADRQLKTSSTPDRDIVEQLVVDLVA